MTKRIAISQSNYLPWKGYFDMISSVDEFVLYDEAQYTRRDWRNRNRIRTDQGLHWLTVPVLVKGKYLQSIESTRRQRSRLGCQPLVVDPPCVCPGAVLRPVLPVLPEVSRGVSSQRGSRRSIAISSRS